MEAACGVRGPTLAPRQEAVPVRLPLPRNPQADSIFDDQARVAGRFFASKEAHPDFALKERAT